MVEHMRNRIESVHNNVRPNSVSMLIVGNKSDLRPDLILGPKGRLISRRSGEELAKRLAASGHYECSACGPEAAVRNVFDELCREVVSTRLRAAHHNKMGRRRSSLSQVRQGLKMLVNVQKASKTKSQSVSSSGENSPSMAAGADRKSPAVLGGRRGSKFGLHSIHSPFATLLSAPLLNDVPEEESRNEFFESFESKNRKQHRNSLGGGESSPEHHHHRDDSTKQFAFLSSHHKSVSKPIGALVA